MIDPNLDAELSVSGLCFREAVVNVSAQGCQRNVSVDIMLGSRDLGSAYTAGQFGLDSLCAGFHRSAHRLLHRAAEGHTVLQLLSDILGDQLRVHLRTSYFDDVKDNLVLCHLLDLGLQLVNRCAALSDNNAGLGSIYRNLYTMRCALDIQLGNAGGVQLLLQEFTDLIVFYEYVAESIVIGEPLRTPVFNDPYTQALWINFLSPRSPPYLSFRIMVI